MDNSQVTTELIGTQDWDLGLENVMQIELLPELPPSGDYENIITANGAFSCYAFAYPLSVPTTFNTAKVIIVIMTRHDYLPTIMTADKAAIFVSKVLHEKAEFDR